MAGQDTTFHGKVYSMRMRQAFVLSAVSVALVLAGAASASALTQSPSDSGRYPAAAGHAAGPLLLPRAEIHAKPASPGCGFVNVVPYDRYKGLPDFTPARAARPYIAKLYTSQGLIVIKALTAQAPCTT